MRAVLMICVLAMAGVSTSAMAPARASDVTANGALTNLQQANTVCPQTCEAYECAWSGEWRPAIDDNAAVCDCGIKRKRLVPGGYAQTLEQTKAMCTETCGLNGDTWDGSLSSLPGSFDMCACNYVSDYCPTDQK